jgi:hypothetical protein
MSDLTRLDHRLDAKALTCRVVIETPKGQRGKLAYDPVSGAFELKRMLPDGMSFPLDFGFVPGTRGRTAIRSTSWSSTTSLRRDRDLADGPPDRGDRGRADRGRRDRAQRPHPGGGRRLAPVRQGRRRSTISTRIS